MRASGCEVPEFMLAIKKPDKRIPKKLRFKTPTRETISTSLKFRRRKSGKNNQESDSLSSEIKLKNGISQKKKIKNCQNSDNRKKLSKKQNSINGENFSAHKKTLSSKKVKSKIGFKKTK